MKRLAVTVIVFFVEWLFLESANIFTPFAFLCLIFVTSLIVSTNRHDDRTTDRIRSLSLRIDRLEGLAGMTDGADGVLDVILTSPGKKTAAVTRLVREITGSSLKKAFELVSDSPCTVVMDAPPTRALEIRRRLADEGAVVELRKVR